MKVGIVGGIGPESTVDYYKSIIMEYQRKFHDDNYPRIVIDSVNMKEMLSYVGARDWDSLTGMLVKSVGYLSASGADFAVIASNTPHVVFDRVSSKVGLQMLSIVEETCKKSRLLGLKRLGLLGTGFTMKENFYSAAFAAAGMEIVLPNIDEQEYIQKKLFSEIEFGVIKNETKYGLLSIAGRMCEEDGIDGLILGCTELPLILKDGEGKVPFLDTAQIHVESIVERLAQLRDGAKL